MKKVLTLIVVGALGLFAVSRANAGDPYHQTIRNHANHHLDLDHRAYHRDLDHRQAHLYPMTGYQHVQLHENLNHQGFHDSLEHSSAHINRAYTPRYYRGGYNTNQLQYFAPRIGGSVVGYPQSSFGCRSPNFSFYYQR